MFLVLLYYYMYYLYGYLFSIFYVRQTCKYLCNLMLLSNSDIYLFHLSCYYLSHVIAAHGLRLLLWSSSEDLVVEPLELAFKPLNIFPLFCYIFGISLSDPLVLQRLIMHSTGQKVTHWFCWGTKCSTNRIYSSHKKGCNGGS